MPHMNLTFGERLKIWMSRREMTVESLALESGYSEGYIVKVRNGHRNNPTLMCVEGFAAALDIEPQTLAGWDI